MTPPSAYVVDASVAVKWYLPEEGQAQARALAVEAQEGRVQLVAPELLATEVANAAPKRQQRGELLPEEACRIAAVVQEAPLTFVDVPPLLIQATSIATRFDCTVYDSLYLALAEAYDAVLITAGSRMCEKVPEGVREKRIRLLSDFSP